MMNLFSCLLYCLLVLVFTWLVRQTNRTTKEDTWECTVFSEYSVAGLFFSFVIGNWLFACILAATAVAAQMDKKTKSVYDYLSFIPMVAAVIALVVQKPLLFGKGAWVLWLPLIFTVATAFARGLADTFFMVLFALYGMTAEEPLMTILGYLIAYIAQLLIKLYKCHREGKPYREGKGEEALPFMPALYYGFAVSVLIYTIGW